VTWCWDLSTLVFLRDFWIRCRAAPEIYIHDDLEIDSDLTVELANRFFSEQWPLAVLVTYLLGVALFAIVILLRRRG